MASESTIDNRTLAAYGIDPSSAVAAENPEDGGVEEEDEDDDDDSDDEDDVKLVFSGQNQRAIDNRSAASRLLTPELTADALKPHRAMSLESANGHTRRLAQLPLLHP